MSQEELAERAGVSARAIGDIETGISLWPRAITISLIAEALQLDATARETLRLASSRRGLASSTELPEGAPLVGREAEMAAALALLRDEDVRLVTLTGGPGVGKTALAVAVARALDVEFGARTRFIDFAALADPMLVPTKISLAVGVRDVRGNSVTASVAAAIGGAPMLILMDNFERVAAAAPFVAELLAAAPQLKVLVASRARLRLRAERTLTVGPLATQAGIALLLERVRSFSPNFALPQDEHPALATLAETLGGVPLAIELAAPLLRTSSAAELATRLERPLDVLVTQDRRLPQRQRTMRDAIAWSYALLPPDDQRLFRRLAVFGGSFIEEGVQKNRIRWCLVQRRPGNAASTGGADRPEPRPHVRRCLRRGALRTSSSAQRVRERVTRTRRRARDGIPPIHRVLSAARPSAASARTIARSCDSHSSATRVGPFRRGARMATKHRASGPSDRVGLHDLADLVPAGRERAWICLADLSALGRARGLPLATRRSRMRIGRRWDSAKRPVNRSVSKSIWPSCCPANAQPAIAPPSHRCSPVRARPRI